MTDVASRPTVPLVDLRRQHATLLPDLLAEIGRIAMDGDFVLGHHVRELERDLAAYVGVGHAVGVGNGTDAVELALRALEIGPGDEVIVPANTFVATAEAVARTGAALVLADCDPQHLLLDPAAASAVTTPATAAVVPVHLHGQVAPVDAIRRAVGSGVAVVEDAAQAHGARHQGRAAMSLGDLAATSFYPGKNLGAWGDAGAVLTSDAVLAARVRALRNHGSEERYVHDHLGTNSRLDTIQAAVLLAKLPHLDAWNRERRTVASRYDTLLEGVRGITRPRSPAGTEPVWHCYVVRISGPARRDRVLARLHEAGIGAAVHYPTPVHLHGAFRWLGLGPGDLPVAEAACREILSLPIFPGITPAEQERVVEALVPALEDS